MAEDKVKEPKKSNILVLVIVGLVVFILIVFLVKRRSNQTGLQSNTMPVAGGNQTETIVTESQAKVIEVEGGSFYFKPNQIKANVEEKVKIVFKSSGGSHNFVIDEFAVQTKLTADGETSEVEFIPNKAGTFEFYCSVGNHRAMGMKGTLIVE